MRAQDLRHLHARELAGQIAAAAQDLAHLRARQLQPVRGVVRARARGGQAAARAAEERGVELDRGHAELGRGEAVEHGVRVEGAVELAHAGVIASDEQVRDAVVLARQRVEERFARSRVAHGGGEGGQDRAVLGVVPGHQRLVGLEARGRGHVVALRLAHQGMEDEAVRDFEGHLGEVLVRAVDGVARLEPGHALPAAGRDLRAQLARGQAVARERQLGQGQHTHGAADERARPREQVRDTRVARVFRPVDGARLLQRIAHVHVLDAEHAPDAAGSVPQGGFARRAQEVAGPVLHGQGERKRPHGAVGQAQALQDRTVVGEAEEADERAGRTGGDELQVGELARVERDLGKALRAVAQGFHLLRGDEAVDERTAVGFNQPGHD